MIAAAQAVILLIGAGDRRPAFDPAPDLVLATLPASLSRCGADDAAIGAALDAPCTLVIIDAGPAALAAAQAVRRHPDGARIPIIFLLDDDAATQAGFPFAQAYALGQVDHLARALIPSVLAAKIATLQALATAFNNRFEDVFTTAPAFMALLRGPEHVFELVNDHYRELTGQRDLIGQTVRAGLPELAGQGMYELLDRVYTSGEPFIGQAIAITIQRHPGAAPEEIICDFIYAPMRDTRRRVYGILVHGVEQTARTRAERELRASEERYRTLFESVDQGFCILQMEFDAGGKALDYRFLEMNAVFEQHTGLVGAVGKTARQMVPDLDQSWFDLYGKVARSGESVRFVNGAEAMQRWFDVFATRVGGDGSNKVALLFNDITAKKLADIELQQLATDLADANQRKSEFLATLAHELRNPLAPIRSGLQVMRLAGDNPAAIARVRDMLERQVGNMVHLVDDLLDIARITSGKIELKRARVALRQLIDSAVETSMPLLEARHHTLALDLPAAALWIDADQTRMVQVLSNLLNNAAKFTPPQGRIGIAVRSVAGHGNEGSEGSAGSAHHTVEIAVSDNGVGLAPESLPLVFQMFSQVGRDGSEVHGGLGIGLSLVSQLVDMHGGTVAVASDGVGRGCTFTVRLPLAVAAHGAAGGDAVQAGAAGLSTALATASATASATGLATGLVPILIVDDNTDAAETMALLLGIGGHQVRVAHDGAQALTMVRDSAPGLVFLDIGLPDMNGYEVARAMRAMPQLAATRIVALTGWGSEDDRQRSADAGFDQHLTKPINFGEIEAILAALPR